jgi:hypothetical protein
MRNCYTHAMLGRVGAMPVPSSKPRVPRPGMRGAVRLHGEAGRCLRGPARGPALCLGQVVLIRDDHDARSLMHAA